MWGLRRPLFAATILFCVGIVVPAGAAQEAPPLEFTDEKLETNCNELAAGKELAIVNSTVSVQPLNLLLSPSNTAGGEVADACSGLSFVGAPQSVPAGDSVTVTLQANDDTDPDEAISGAVVAFGAAGTTARLPLTIAPVSNAGPATPLVDSVSGTEYRDRTGTPIWIPVDLGDKTTASFEVGDVVGAVSGDADRAAVTYVETKNVDGTPMVGLAVSDLAAGDYEGAVDLLPDADEGDVSLTLSVKDWWVWPLVALAAGLLAAFLVQRLAGVWIPRIRLRSKAAGVEQTYRTALRLLAAAPGEGSWKESTLSDVGVKIKKLKDDVSTKTKGAYVSIDQKVIDALDTAIDAADVLVARFGELADVLPLLASDLKRLPDERPKQLPPLVGIDPPPDEPALAAAARGRLTKRALATSGIATELDAVTAERKTIDVLIRLEQYTSSLYSDGLALKKRFEEAGDQKLVAEVEQSLKQLGGIRRQVWRATEPSLLEQLRAELLDVDKSLSPLWPPEADERAAIRDGFLLTGADMAEVFEGMAEVYRIEPEIDEEVEEARREAALGRWLQLVVLAVMLILAVVAGMGALYIDKPFGTVWDYISITTWGLVTPTALTVAAAALNNLGALTALGQRLRV